MAAYELYASFLRIAHAEGVACISSFLNSLPAQLFINRLMTGR